MKRRKAQKILLILVEFLLLAVFLFAGFKLWNYYRAGKENQELYTALAEKREEKLELPKALSPAEVYGSFEEQNPDFAAWLTIEDTIVDYPVMQSKAEDYYLYRNFEKKYSAFGSLYLSEGCDPDRSQNLLIHGHHMKNGSMFAVLTKYTSEKFYKEHKIIRFDTLQSFGTYEILAAFKVDLAKEEHFSYYDFTDGSEEEFNAYLEKCKARSFYDTGVEAQFGDRLLTLSTCEYTQKDGRMVIVAKRTEDKKE